MIKGKIHQNKNTEKSKKSTLYFFLKRLFDIVVSTFAIIVLFIPMCIIALVIKSQDGGPAIYKAERAGLNGKPFSMLKFRSMKLGADNLEEYLSPELLKKYKSEYKLDNDPRLTKTGSYIRKTSLDEVPQFFNVFAGQMSLVGPRPVVKEELAFYGEQKAKFLSVKPGLTGYWQAYARNDVGYNNGERQNMELYYVDNRSIMFDLKIVFRTVKCVITKRGAK